MRSEYNRIFENPETVTFDVDLKRENGTREVGAVDVENVMSVEEALNKLIKEEKCIYKKVNGEIKYIYYVNEKDEITSTMTIDYYYSPTLREDEMF